ncbi:flagellar basal-body rod protein FlgG [Thermanaerovibrio acidaminovorans DSM 6589]|uniref:Flagellar basal-body rod protein FlgG n=1 Tax=Thermanaerovibrio acidaminovorans (strain ATCC 49978 / DSM 6589 / Su883) TaxID=525903 RepID=D1B5T8_THEAS|nr:flagellar basal-body rod protein FlgG [Thermanaerovibrio acidaminovorans]ACZ19379.1 flagellar basal-body rod protein FlgG [Thermanaerovibrio acidaminovorans DSM 6589]
MIRSLWSGATGMIAQQTNLDVVSHNLANVNTAGFKKLRADFQDLMYQIDREPGAPVEPASMVPNGIQVGLGSRVSGTSRIMGQGNMQVTGNPTDVAIEGDGFFQVTMPDGTVAYTRDGAWRIDGNGQIVTADGYLLEPAVTVPNNAKEIIISPTGQVSVLLPGDQNPQEIGQIQLARFVNPGGLKALGKNLFIETPASGAPIVGNPGEEGLGTTIQRTLEMANVQVVEEMVNMIVAQRAYEANSKTIATADELLRIANNLRR